jgi:hypothetical protein
MLIAYNAQYKMSQLTVGSYAFLYHVGTRIYFILCFIHAAFNIPIFCLEPVFKRRHLTERIYQNKEQVNNYNNCDYRLCAQ